MNYVPNPPTKVQYALGICCESGARVEGVPGDATTLMGWRCEIHGVSIHANQQEHMQYLGVLKVLADCSLMLEDSDGPGDAEDMRDTIERVLIDAQKVVPRLRWKRVLSRFDIELADEFEQCPHGNDLVPEEDASCGCRG